MSEHSEHKKEPPSPGKVFAYLAAVGIGLVILAVGAESLYNMSRSISMSFDLLTKPILIIVVLVAVFNAYSASKEGKGDKGGDHHDAHPPAHK